VAKHPVLVQGPAPSQPGDGRRTAGGRAAAGGPGRNQPRPDDNSDFIYYPVRLRLLGVVSQCQEIRLGK